MKNVQKSGKALELLLLARGCDEEGFTKALKEFFKSNKFLKLRHLYNDLELSEILNKIEDSYLKKIRLIPTVDGIGGGAAFIHVEITLSDGGVIYLECWYNLENSDNIRNIMCCLINPLRDDRFKKKVFLANQEYPFLDDGENLSFLKIAVKLLAKATVVDPMLLNDSPGGVSSFLQGLLNTCDELEKYFATK